MRGVALLALLAAGGCARMTPGLGFDQVQRSVLERTGRDVRWDSGTVEDQEAREAVHALLKDGLTEDRAVQVALLNNRDLQAVYEELSIAQADLVQAGLLRNPVFAGEVRWATTGSGTGAALDVSMDFVSLLYMPMRKGLAGAGFEAAKIRVTGAVLDLAGRTRAAFLEVQSAEQMRELRGTVAEAMGASHELALRLRAAGNIRELDAVSERVAYEQAKLDLGAAEAEVAARREELNELMGVWGADAGWRLSGRLPEVPESEEPAQGFESRAVERSLELDLARREVEIAARALGIAKPAALLSELDAGVAAEKEVGGDWSVGPSLALPIPLFDQGQAREGAARARLRQASQRYFAQAVAVRARARSAWSAVAAARDRAVYIERMLLPLRQRIVDESQLQYNAMQIGAFQLLQARRDQAEAGAQYVDSLRAYWLARVRLDQILSGRMMGGAEPAQSAAIARTPGGEGGH